MTETPEIDLRDTPVWERPALVGQALDRLPSGASLTFITENEPRGLSAGIVQERTEHYVIESRRVARMLWRVRFTPRGQDAAPTAIAAELGTCAAFAKLDEAALGDLAAAAIPQAGKRGEALVEENADWPYVGMVVEGIVARAKGGQARRERILYEVHAHELFGVSEYFDRGLSNARIEVFSKTARILKLPWEVISDVAVQHPALTTALAVIIAQRLRAMNDSLTLQGSMPILARIAGVLLPYAMPGKGLIAASVALSSVTQSQIAAAAGTVKEVAARTIAELETSGALRRERGHIRYLDRLRLLDIVRERT